METDFIRAGNSAGRVMTGGWGGDTARVLSYPSFSGPYPSIGGLPGLPG